MEDVVALVVTGAFWVSCFGVGCLLGMWFQGKLSALWTAIRNDREMIGELQKRVEKLESKVVGENTVVWNYHTGMSDDEKREMIEQMRKAMSTSELSETL